jgi:hypothetical protein
MLFHKSLAVLVASIASTSSVTAVIVRSNPICPIRGSLTCCTDTVSFSSLTASQSNALSQADSFLDTSLPVGTGCFIPDQSGSFDAWYRTPYISQSIRRLTCSSDFEMPVVADVFCCDSIQTQGQRPYSPWPLGVADKLITSSH